ncbi:hypothetical protein M3667_10615 [Microbacterium sp. P26]|uniref:hypothetical protein n=1 Tax=Microbacterium TaxID=33882 RepID=UPI00203FB6C1|nr:hypothetical protein [Microbacterium sp. P26]MCM3502325.1 hypothetical protein [Microbacterium sp. P26]
MGLSFALLAVSVAVAAAVGFVAFPRLGTPGRVTLFLRYAAVAGVTAVGSSAMYFIYGAGGGLLPLVLGDVAMVLAPALMLVAVTALDERRVRRASTFALVLALIVAVVTAAVPLPASLAVKAVALAAACAACAWAASHSRVEPFGPLRIIAFANAIYALYCLARVVVALAAGWESPLYLTAFSFGPATILGAAAVVAMGVSVVRLWAGPRAEVRPEVCPAGVAVVVGDWDLASAAYGPDRMRDLVVDLRAAAHDLDPHAADVPRGAELTVADPVEALGARLRDAYGWAPEQTILLADGAATAAIRTRPGRTRPGRWGRGVSRS